MRYLRNDYPRPLLEQLNDVYDDMPPVPPAHVYIVTTKNFEDQENPDFSIIATHHSLIVAHRQATNLFKSKYLMWFMQSLNFENWARAGENLDIEVWARGQGDLKAFDHIVKWEVHDQGGLDLEAWRRSKDDPNNIEFVGSVEVEYHLINGI